MSKALPRPLGVFLSGGGALGAWQAGALGALLEDGVVFDEVMGFSIGAINGAALAFGLMEDAMLRWRSLDAGVMRLSPRLFPPSLFSDGPLRNFLAENPTEASAAAELKIPLTVISACPARGQAIYARFTPGGRDGWAGPLAEHVAASSAVPLIFPPVNLYFRGERLRLIDGGVPQPTPMRFDALARCATVLVLEMVRADEVGRRPWNPWFAFDQAGRESARRLIDEGVSSLLRAKHPPRVHRIAPSRRLDSVMLEFSARSILPRLPMGARDVRAYLAKSND